MKDSTQTEDEDRPLTEAEVLSEGLLVEAAGPRLIIPKRGKVFEEDGTCKVAIIRPCVSRGRRLGPLKLPPIYTPSMLAENAGVFSGWLMYMDHLTESVMVEGERRSLGELIMEAMALRQRSIKELGGRITASHYDPELVFDDDSEYGYQKGGVVGRALPRRVVREMLEDDPALLHVSINAYPKGARPGVAPWDSKVRGMLIEGIRPKPAGTVDWVPRGGAGGRVLAELEVVLERLATEDPTVSGGGPSYSPDDMKLADLTRDQLVARLREENPGLADELGLKESEGTPPARRNSPSAQGGSDAISMEELDRRLAEQRDTLLAESEQTVEDRAAELISEGRYFDGLAEKAKAQITKSGLPAVFQTDLLRRWSVSPSGPTVALSRVAPLMEGDGVVKKTAEDVLKESVDADLQHAVQLIEAANGGARPSVRGLGGGNGGAEHQGGRRRQNSFRDFLRESGDIPPKLPDGKSEDDLVREMIQEGVSD